MLIPPSRPWHRAENAEELLALSKKLGLTPKKAVEPKPLVYRDLLNGTSEPCKLVGCEGERYAIIDIGGVLHTIHIDCLADMQSGSRTRRTEAEPDCPVYTVIDIETTGLDRQTAEIIEFGALRIENGTPSAQFSMLVQASAPVPPVCARLTGITDDMLAGQPEIREALSAFVAFIGDTPLVGQICWILICRSSTASVRSRAFPRSGTGAAIPCSLHGAASRCRATGSKHWRRRSAQSRARRTVRSATAKRHTACSKGLLRIILRQFNGHGRRARAKRLHLRRVRALPHRSLRIFSRAQRQRTSSRRPICSIRRIRCSTRPAC